MTLGNDSKQHTSKQKKPRNVFEIKHAVYQSFLLDLYKLDRIETAKREFEARKLYDQTILRVSTAALLGTLLGYNYLPNETKQCEILVALALCGFILAIIFVLVSLRYTQLAQDGNYDSIYKEYILLEENLSENRFSKKVTRLGKSALGAIIASFILSFAFFFLNSPLWMTT